MESSETRERIFNLGKALVDELGLDPSSDTLSRWMAHYVAEQLTLVEKADSGGKIEAEKQCFETILKLWHHRAQYPGGKRPFENFEPIFHTLERIDPDNPKPLYYSTSPDDSNNGENDVQQWVDVALGIDQAARVWLEYVFHQAVQNASDKKTLKWLESAMGLPVSNDVQIITQIQEVYRVKDNSEANTKVNQEKRELVESRIKKLDAFIEFSQILRRAFVDYSNEISNNDEVR